MGDTIVQALGAAIAAAFAAFVAALTGAIKAHQDLRETRQLAKDVNGRLTELLEGARRESYASGYTDGFKAASALARAEQPEKPGDVND